MGPLPFFSPTDAPEGKKEKGRTLGVAAVARSRRCGRQRDGGSSHRFRG
jgi:hypothetical protein